MKIEDYNEYYIQGSDHYLIPKDVFIELFEEMENWREESQRQKEVIDEAIEYINSCIGIEVKEELITILRGRINESRLCS